MGFSFSSLLTKTTPLHHQYNDFCLKGCFLAKIPRQLSESGDPEAHQQTVEMLELLGVELASSLRLVIESIPDCSMRPTDIARVLGISRPIVSRTISAIKKSDPSDLLSSIPGPESLRSMMHAAKIAGAPAQSVQEAVEAIGQFSSLIREKYGTRAALNADLSVSQSDSKEKFEQASRYQIFNGMSQMLGVQCKVWLNCLILTPNKDAPFMLDRSSVFGASGLRRLRPDMPTRLAIGVGPREVTSPFPDRSMTGVRPDRRLIDLSSFYTYPRAPTVSVDEGDRVIDVFSPLVVDKESVYDLLGGAYVPNAVSQSKWPRASRKGLVVAPDVPAAVLNLDILLHRDVVFDNNPEAFVYNVGLTGTSRFDSENWELNRVASSAKIQELGTGLQNIGISEVARYPEMIHHVCKEAGFDPSEFRAFRWRMEYPVFGFQHMLAFSMLDSDGV